MMGHSKIMVKKWKFFMERLKLRYLVLVVHKKIRLLVNLRILKIPRWNLQVQAEDERVPR